jgi:hypothetical protein
MWHYPRRVPIVLLVGAYPPWHYHYHSVSDFQTVTLSLVLTGLIDITPATVGVSKNSSRGAGINLVVSRAANSTTAQSFFLRVPSIYNRLPSNVKTIKSVTTFRRHVQRHC